MVLEWPRKGIEVPFYGQGMLYTNAILIGKAVHSMTQQFKYVGDHIEVYSEYGEFLFSADTMQEAWEELSA